jgi:hypothetical protein
MAKSPKTKRKKPPRTVLKLPDLEQSKSAVLSSLGHREFAAILRFVSSSNGIALNHDWLSTKRLSLGIGSLWNRSIYAPSTINLRLAAVRRLA